MSEVIQVQVRESAYSIMLLLTENTNCKYSVTSSEVMVLPVMLPVRAETKRRKAKYG